MRRTTRRPVPESPRGYKPVPSTPEMVTIKSELTPSPHLLDHGYGATPQNQMISTSFSNQAPAVKRKLNMESQHIIVPIKQEFKQPPQPKKQKRTSPTKKNTRYDTSLGLLTKKFTALLEQSPTGVVDLNKASSDMKVPKRRIYDITNVLEGIGILEKKSKNNIQWKGGSRSSCSIKALKRDIEALDNQENELNALIKRVTSDLHNLNNSKHGYITYHDLRSIPKFKNKTVMAIRAPPNANLNVPAEAEDGYKIHLKSDTDEIEVFLCPETVSPPKVKNVPPMDSLLKDYPTSPGLFSFTTPPVPEFDSPTPDHKPISSQICRKISFPKESKDFKDPVFESVGAPKSVRQSITFSSVSSSTSSNEALMNPVNTITLSPINNMFQTSSTPDRFSNLLINDYSWDKFGFKVEDTDQTGMLDPMLCESLIPLEPFPNSEYTYGLDAGEGLADLYSF
ncbi:hypothetical protein Trydic_g8034 [Trypoxylus dichotomus]